MFGEPLLPPDSAVARGRLAEDIASAWLRLRGMTVLDRNRRGPRGEIDLLARTGPCLVFVEVRLRHGTSWVDAAGSIGPTKRARLRATARELLARREDLRWPGRTLRFDVVTLRIEGDALHVEHLEAVRV